jgi:hypothetical protein
MNPEVQFMNGMDERLRYVLESVKKAVQVFLNAVKDMEYACKFKAFDIVNVKENDKNALVEVIKEAFAIEIGEQALESIKKITYSYNVESDGDNHTFWFNAIKEVPDYDKLAPPEEESKIEEIEESESKSESVAPDAYSRPGSE